MRVWFAAVLLALTWIGQAHAVQPDEMLANPKLEARARAIGKELRCLVCQNQSIDDSDADLAHDLRVLLRRRLLAGDSDAQAKQYIVDRYGDYVLLDPPFKPITLALWCGPFVLFAGACAGAWAFYRGRPARKAVPAPLDEEQRARVNALLDERRP